jgi:HPt (histidine-containing phosphotransfer) domain-containing protein
MRATAFSAPSKPVDTAKPGNPTMAPPVDQQFFERLREMNDKFAAGVPATLARLEGLAAAFDPAAPDRALAAELQQVLHTIAGSAATFGFRTFGAEARVLEQRLRVLQAFEQVGAAEWTSWLHSLGHYLAWAGRDARADSFPAEKVPGDV